MKNTGGVWEWVIVTVFLAVIFIAGTYIWGLMN